MVEEGRDCADVLIQLAAIRAAVDRVARLVLEDHVESCLRQAVTNGTPDDEWESLKREPLAVTVRDAGLTQVEAGTEIVVALPVGALPHP